MWNSYRFPGDVILLTLADGSIVRVVIKEVSNTGAVSVGIDAPREVMIEVKKPKRKSK